MVISVEMMLEAIQVDLMIFEILAVMTLVETLTQQKMKKSHHYSQSHQPRETTTQSTIEIAKDQDLRK